MISRTISKSVASYSTKRLFHSTLIRSVKDDKSTIDSFKLPSQTSINEWEFKYDFIPKTSEPKIPPVTPEAVKQDIAQEKKATIVKEMLDLEVISIKAEASPATVLHGGESVSDEPEFLQDYGSKPVDASHPTRSNDKPSKPANREKYIQTSINPNINQSDVVNMGENEVDHKASTVNKQEKVVDDLEHDNLHKQTDGSESAPKQSPGVGFGVPLAILGLGAGGYFYYTSTSDSKKK